MDYYVPGSQRMSSLSTESGQLSATVTMTLMQMVADVYEEARIEWERNSQRETVEGVDNPQLFGPNDAQLAVEGWLVHAQFLPPRERPMREVAKEVETYVTTLPQVPKKSPAKSIFSVKRLPTVTWRLFPPTRICKFASRFKVPLFLSLHFPKSWKAPRPKSGLNPARDSATVSISVDARSMSPPSTPTSSRSRRSSTETLSSPSKRFSRPSRIRPLDLSPQVAQAPLPRAQSPRMRSEPPLPRIDERVMLPVSPITDAPAGLPGQNYTLSISAEIIQSKPEAPSPRHEVTVWTLMVITSFGYFCFFLLFVICIIAGMRRLVYKVISLVVWSGIGSN